MDLQITICILHLQVVSVLLGPLSLVTDVLLLRSAHPHWSLLQWIRSVQKAWSTRSVGLPAPLRVTTRMRWSLAPVSVYKVGSS